MRIHAKDNRNARSSRLALHKKWAFTVAFLIPSLASAANSAYDFLSPLGVKLAKYPRPADIKKAFGDSPIRWTGDAATAVGRVCYRTKDGSAVFAFSWTELTVGFSMSRPASGSKQTCAVTSRKGLSARTIRVNGIRLGMSRAAYQALLASPKYSRKKPITEPSGARGYRFEWHETHKGELFDTWSYVVTKFSSDDRLSYLWVNYGSSN